MKSVILFLGSAMAASSATLMFEDFEDSTVNYVSSESEASDGFGDYYGRVGTSGISVGTFINISGVQGAGYFALSDIDANGTGDPNITAGFATITFTVDVSNHTNLAFSGLFAEDDDGTNQDWDDPESFTVSASLDGAPAQTIFAIEAAALRPDNSASTTNKEPLVDTDFDGIGDGTALTDTLSAFSAGIAGTGSSLELTFTFTSFNSGDEDLAFDNIEVTGDLIPEPSSALLGGLGLLTLLRRRR